MQICQMSRDEMCHEMCDEIQNATIHAPNAPIEIMLLCVFEMIFLRRKNGKMYDKIRNNATMHARNELFQTRK